MTVIIYFNLIAKNIFLYNQQRKMALSPSFEDFIKKNGEQYSVYHVEIGVRAFTPCSRVSFARTVLAWVEIPFSCLKLLKLGTHWNSDTRNKKKGGIWIQKSGGVTRETDSNTKVNPIWDWHPSQSLTDFQCLYLAAKSFIWPSAINPHRGVGR